MSTEEVIRQAIEDWYYESAHYELSDMAIKQLAAYIAKRLEHEPRSME